MSAGTMQSQRQQQQQQQQQLRPFQINHASLEDWSLVVNVLAPFTAQERVERFNQVLSKRRKNLHIVLENIDNPYDTAAILRTAEGLGIQYVHTIDSSRTRADATAAGEALEMNKSTRDARKQVQNRMSRGSRGPRRVTRRALGNVAMGAGRWLSLQEHQSAHECYIALKALSPNLQILASVAAPDVELGLISRFDRTKPLDKTPDVAPWRQAIHPRPLDSLNLRDATDGIALVFGPSLSRKALEYADAAYYLPSVCGFTREFSLSVQMATGIYEAISAGVAPEGTLDESERTELLGRWLLRDVRAAKQILRAQAKLQVEE